ncbi:MAG: hypothetical protein SOZ23_03595 [Methanosphaera sp.]|uniref:hypothetical protein n=1 Tax=Methanosphaera sp. TaxID=2666342 RepID=UPI0025DADC70|nr:hypothetical protein [Methanosphaera sp.]MCI5867462.1 hypothetical protein [Methanosphaera sp.]MDD6534470.1 hypothetical protein [Methanosphaera sp.]MDY3955861.1 hypothetical protein [Methanosphaera sp.]
MVLFDVIDCDVFFTTSLDSIELPLLGVVFLMSDFVSGVGGSVGFTISSLST